MKALKYILIFIFAFFVTSMFFVYLFLRDTPQYKCGFAKGAGEQLPAYCKTIEK